MAASNRHTGWRNDPDNDRLDMYYKGTRVGHVDACGMAVACSLNFTQGSLSHVSCSDGEFLRVNCVDRLQLTCSVDLMLSSGTMHICGGTFQWLNGFSGCLADMFLASSCSEPSCAAKGVVWAWQGDACATAPCGSAFLMITDDGCV